MIGGTEVTVLILDRLPWHVGDAAADLILRISHPNSQVAELAVEDMNLKSVVTEIADACVPLRRRQCDIIVGSVCYLPTAHSYENEFQR